MARNPVKVICLNLVVTGILTAGLFNFYEEKDMVKLWIPEDSDFSKNSLWLKDNFPPKLR